MIITDGRPKVVLVYHRFNISHQGTGVLVASIKEDAGMGTTVSYYRAGMSLMMVGRAMLLLVCHRARRSNGDLMIRGGHSMRVEEPKQ